MANSAEPLGREGVEDVLARVRASGGRVTTARRQVLEALFEGEDHCTAEDVAATVHARSPDIHLSTIYRNLDELERLGIVVHTHLGHGPATYHLASSPHGHLVCERCGETFEAPADLFRSLSKVARSRFGFTIDPRHFAVFGRCRACAAEPVPPAAI